MRRGTWIRTVVAAAALAALAWPAPLAAQEITSPEGFRDRIVSTLESCATKVVDTAAQFAGKPKSQAVQCALYHLAWELDWGNEKARAFLGYDKDGWNWRRNEKKRAALAELVMDEGFVPAEDQRKVLADCAAAQAATMKKLVAAGRARKTGANKAAERAYTDMIDNLEYWAIWVDPSDEAARRADGEPAVWGLLVRPWYRSAMQIRYEHERVLDAAAGAAVNELHDEPPGGEDATAGAKAVARTPHVVVRSWTSPEHARAAAKQLETAWRVLTAEGPTPKAAKSWQVHLVPDRTSMEAVIKLRAGDATSKALDEGRKSAFASFRTSDDADHFVACDMTGVPALDRVVSRVAHDACDAAKIGDEWQIEGIAELLAAEASGRADETFQGGPPLVEGKPGTWKRNAVQPSAYREGVDLWSRQRWLVACDLDPAFSDVTFKEAREMTRADRLKAAGAVRFLKEYWRENRIAPADKRVQDEYASTATPTFPLWGRSFADFDWQYRAFTRETR